MKKVGIITVHHYGNYGSSLQAYASQKVFENLGYETYVIDYRSPNVCYATEKYMTYDTVDDSFWQTLEKNRRNFLNRFVRKVLSEPHVCRFLYRTFGITRGVDIHQLWLANMRMTKRYDTLQELFADPPHFDVYVVGGDQLWNTHITYNNPAYYLAFADQKAKKISFSTSIGIPAVPKSALETFKKGLNNLSSILVREEEAVTYLQSLGYAADRVLDPVLMLSRETWELMRNTDYHIPFKKYILAYFLDSDEWTEMLLRTVQKQNGLPVIVIGKKKRYAAKDTYFVGNIEVATFLTLFNCAEIVVTNSFHGMAFTILFHKKLIATYRDDESPLSMNSRHRNFIKMFQLTCLYERKGFSPDQLSYEMDYDTIDSLLTHYRTETLALLRNALR